MAFTILCKILAGSKGEPRLVESLSGADRAVWGPVIRKPFTGAEILAGLQ